MYFFNIYIHKAPMKVLVTILGYVPSNSELMSKVHTPPLLKM